MLSYRRPSEPPWLHFLAGVVALLCLSAPALAQERINAPATATVGVPVSVEFTGLTAPEYLVNWGDGQSETLQTTRGVSSQTLVHTYTAAGQLTVQLSYPRGGPLADAAIQVSSATGCSIFLNPSPAIVGSNVTATASGLDANTEVRLEWGDGSPTQTITTNASGGLTQTHSFSAVGTFVVMIKVGGTPACQTSLVVSYPTPQLSLVPSPTVFGQSTQANLSNLTSALSYTLDWGDGETETVNPTGATAALSHTYAALGNKVVKLSAAGIPDVIQSHSVYVPQATLSLNPDSVLVNQSVSAVLSGLSSNVNYTLDWGDGTNETITGQTSKTLTHSYPSAGLKVVSLSAEGMNPATASLTVNLPSCNFNSTPAQLLLGESVNATVSGLPSGFEFQIHWGDEADNFTTSSAQPFSVGHTYTSTGAYALRTLYQGNPLCPEVTNVTVTVPQPALNLSNLNPQLGEVVGTTLSNLAPAVNYTLEWGDGETETVSNKKTASFNHTYTTPGPKVVVLKATNHSVAPNTQTLTVQAPVPVLVLSGSVALGQPAIANISNLVPGLSYTLSWGDGDAETITGQTSVNRSHSYISTGVKAVQISASGIAPQVGSVQVQAPSLSFTPSDPAVGQNVQFSLTNVYAGMTYTLNLGDGNSKEVAGGTANHAYSSPGPKLVTLEAPAGYTLSPITVTVPVGGASCSVTTDFSSLLLGNSVKASVAGSYSGMGMSLEWGDGDGQAFSVGANLQFTANKVYSQKGTYLIKVMFAGASLCQTTVNVVVPQPTLNLGPNALLGQTVTANISSLAPGETYTLEWGDGDTETITGQTSVSRSHTYTSAGSKLVKLTAANIVPVTQTVTVVAPSLSAAQSSLLVGQNASVDLSDLNPSLVYTLDWGDGQTTSITGKSNDTQTHTYWSSGPKIIRLNLPSGYTATIAPATITGVAPDLGVSSNSLMALEVLTVNLSDLNPALSYSLSWGDGQSDTISGKPSHTLTHSYVAAGAKTITLHNSNMTPDVTQVVAVALPNCSLALNPASLLVGGQIAASVSGLPASFATTLDWGDSNSQAVTANSSGAIGINHVFASTGVFTVKVLYEGALLCQGVATLTVPTPGLTATPTSATVGQNISISLSDLAPGISYTLEWGDGSGDSISGQASATLSHSYSSTGAKLIQLKAPAGITIPATTATVQVSVPAPVFLVNPATPQIGESITANISDLIAAVSYTLDWGDGNTEIISNKTSISLTHSYATIGSKIVTLTAPAGIILPPITATVSVGVSAPTLNLSTQTPVLGQNVSASIGGLSAALSYSFEWGDGSTESISGQTTANLSHRYQSDGAKLAKLIPPSGLGLSPITVSLTVSAPTLSIAPGIAAPGQTITATLTNLEPSLSYTLEWGDGEPSDTISNKSTAIFTRSYTSTGSKLVRLLLPAGYSSTPITGTVSLSNATCGLSLSPSSVVYGLPLTASVSGLPSGYAVMIDWDDQHQDTITANASGNYSANRVILKLGAVTAKVLYGGTVLCQDTITIVIPAPSLSAASASNLLGQTTTLNLSDLAPGVNYRLDWGDGTTEWISGKISETATHTFTSSGTHVPNLTSQGNLTALIGTTIQVSPPGLAFAGDVILGMPSSLSISNLVASLSYTLEWGDGQSETITGKTSLTLSHTYTSMGAKFAQLRAPSGFTFSTVVGAITGIVVPTPTVSFNFTSVLLGQSASATLTKLAPGASYTLNWGDGQSETITGQTSATFSHTYSGAGVFAVTLVESGIIKSSTQINVTTPNAVVSPTSAIIGEIVTADLSNLASAFSYTLEWGDGQIETIMGKSNISLTHAYSSVGVKGVKLTLGNFNLTHTVSVSEPTSCDDLALPGTALLGQGLNLEVLIRQSNNLPLNLDWGDSQTQTIHTNAQGIASASHSFSAVGSFTVKVSYGSSLLCQRVIEVSAKQATLSVTPSTVNAGQNISVQIGDLHSTLSYTLNWGDGTSETISGQGSANLTYSYSSAGNKTITLTPPSGCGLIPVTTSVSVTTPLINYTVSPPSVTPGQTATVNFSGLVVAASYILSWGDGHTETITGETSGSRTHVYTSTGDKVVNLRLSSDNTGGGNVVQVVAPGLSVASTVNLGQALTANLSDLVASLEYTLNWGDGQSHTISGQTSTALSHTYASAGAKTLSLNLPSGYTSSPIQTTVMVVNATCTASANSLLLGQSITYQGSNVAPGAALIEWGDSSSDSITVSAGGSFSASHTYSIKGNYTVKVSRDSATLCQQLVSVEVPAPTLSANPANPALFETFTLTVSNLAPGVSYTLNWGDGNTANISNKTSTTLTTRYSVSGPKTITLSATEITTVTQAINVQLPTIVLSPTSAQPGQTITATVQYLAPEFSYTFRWNDGAQTTLTGQSSYSLTHAYTNPANYTPDLTLPFANNETVSASVSITVPKPAISLSTSQPEPGQAITATFSALLPSGTYRVNWGDGTTESITGVGTASKTHTYTNAGQYTTSITAVGWGQVSDVIVHVNVPQFTLTASPTRIVLGQAMTLQVGNLSAGATYWLDWGDGAGWSEQLSGQTSFTLSRTYASLGPKIIHLKLNGGTGGDGFLSVEVVLPSVIQFSPSPAKLGQSVQADLSSLDPAQNYTLEWGDGQTEAISNQSAANLNHVYTSPGSKSVQLVPASGTPISQTLSIEAPTLSVPATAYVQGLMTVSISHLVPGLTYTLDWGDGTTSAVSSSGAAINTAGHIYQTPGTKTLRLLLPTGLTSDPIVAALDIENQYCQMSLDQNTVFVDANLTTTLSGLPAGFKVDMDWGDGRVNLVNISGASHTTPHIYTTLGSYTVKAMVGGVVLCQQNVTTTVPTPAISLKNTTIASGQTAIATVILIQPSQTYTLDWGDGSSESFSGQTAQQLSHTYPNPGNYIVKVVPPAASGVGPASANLVVQVQIPGFSFNPSLARHGQVVTLNLSGLSSAITYTLSWGDGSSETISSVATASLTHTYLSTGGKTLSLALPTGMQFVGGQNAEQQTLSVVDSTFMVNLEPVAVEVNQSFTLKLTDLLATLTYTIDWGDGSEAVSLKTNADITHSYGQAGVKTISISTPGQSATTASIQAFVRPGLSLSSSNILYGQQAEANITDLASNASYRLMWGNDAEDISGKNSTTLRRLLTPGTYTLTLKNLTATNLPDVTAQVNVGMPACNLTQNLNANVLSLHGSNLPAGLSFTVLWGDGKSDAGTADASGAFSLNHTYYQNGSFTVPIKDRAGLDLTFCTVSVSVNDALPSLSLSSSSIKAGDTLTVTLAQLDSGQTYTLDFGHGTPLSISAKTGGSFSHSYSASLSGNYTVKLVGADGSTLASATVEITPPVYTLSTTNIAPGEPITLNLSNLSPAVSYLVEWGDGERDTVSNQTNIALTHTYNILYAGGERTITISHPQGVLGSLKLSLSRPILKVEPSTVAIHQTATAKLSNLSANLVYYLKWPDGATDIVSGQTSTEFKHTFSTVQNGLVELLVPSGGQSRVLQQVNLGVIPPVLKLTSSLNTMFAPVQFTLEQLSPEISYALDWGDGQSQTVSNQTAINLSHTYTSSGIKTIQLKYQTTVLASIQVSVAPPTGAQIGIEPINSLVGQAVILSLSGMPAQQNLIFDWGDGTTTPLTSDVQGTATLNHTYGKGGLYTLVLKLGQDKLAQRAYRVDLPQATVEFAFEGKTSANVLTKVGASVTAQVSGLVAGTSYTLNWGDGQTESLVASATTADRTHTYTRALSNIKVVFISAEAMPEQLVNINVQVPQIALSPQPLQAGRTLAAQIVGTLGEGNYTLDWGDGKIEPLNTSDLQHIYARSGAYDLKLKLADLLVLEERASVGPAGCSLHVYSSTTNLPSGYKLLAQQEGVFVLEGFEGAGEIDWGDGQREAFEPASYNLAHTYKRPGLYQVSAYNRADGQLICTLGVGVIVPAPKLEVLGQRTTVLIGEPLTVNADGLTETETYLLDWGDGSSETLKDLKFKQLSHVYTNPVSHTLTLKLLSDTLPVKSSTYTLMVGGSRLTLPKNEWNIWEAITAQVAPAASGINYIFNWGDGQTSAGGQEGVHRYSKGGTYKLVVKIVSGEHVIENPLLDSLLSQTITVKEPILNLSNDTLYPNQPLEVKLEGLSAEALEYSLDWGDGKTETFSASHIYKAVHTYTASKQYGIRLVQGDAERSLGKAVEVKALGCEISAPAFVLEGNDLVARLSAVPYSRFTVVWVDPAGNVVDLNDFYHQDPEGKAKTKEINYPVSAKGAYALKVYASAPSETLCQTSFNVYPNSPKVILNDPAPSLGDAVVLKVSNLLPTQAGGRYTLDWGDGTKESVEAKDDEQALSHTYLAPGEYKVALKGPSDIAGLLEPEAMPVKVKLSLTEEQFHTTLGADGQGVDKPLLTDVPTYLVVHGLSSNLRFSYAIQIDDQAMVPLGRGEPGNWTPGGKYTFYQPGSHTFTLLVKLDNGPWLKRGEWKREVLRFQIESVKLVTEQPLPEKGLLLTWGEKFTPYLEIKYSGYGKLRYTSTTQVLSDKGQSQTYEDKVELEVDLPVGQTQIRVPLSALRASSTVGYGDFRYNLIFTQLFAGLPLEGRKLELPDVLSTKTLPYRVGIKPTHIRIGESLLPLGEISSPFPNRFSAKLKIDLVVGGVDYGTHSFDLKDLRVALGSDEKVIGLGRGEAIELPLSRNIGAPELDRVRVDFGGVRLDEFGAWLQNLNIVIGSLGQNRYLGLTYTLPKAPFDLNTGDLYVEHHLIGGAQNQGVAPFEFEHLALTGQAAKLVLDLSRRKNPENLAKSFVAEGRNLEGWMGIYFPEVLWALSVYQDGVPGSTSEARTDITMASAAALDQSGLNFNIKTSGSQDIHSRLTLKYSELEIVVVGDQIVKSGGRGVLSNYMVFGKPQDLETQFQITRYSPWNFTVSDFRKRSFGNFWVQLGEGRMDLYDERKNGAAALYLPSARWGSVGGAIQTGEADNSMPLPELVVVSSYGQSIELFGTGQDQVPYANSNLKVNGMVYHPDGIRLIYNYASNTRDLQLEGRAVVAAGLSDGYAPGTPTTVKFEASAPPSSQPQVEVQSSGASAEIGLAVGLGIALPSGELKFVKTSDGAYADIQNVKVKISNVSDLSGNARIGYKVVGGENIYYGYVQIAADVNRNKAFRVGSMQIDKIFGGVAYHMKWDAGAGAQQFLGQPPTFDPSTPLQIQLGVEMHMEPGGKFRAIGVLSVDVSGQVDIVADAWILKDSGSPNGRGRITINSEGFLANFCLGPSSPPGDQIQCGDLEEFNYKGIVSGKGYAQLMIRADGRFHILLGDPWNPITLHFPANSNAVTYSGYFMAGNSGQSFYIPATKRTESLNGVWIGLGVSYHTSGRESTDIGLCTAYVEWSVGLSFEFYVRLYFDDFRYAAGVYFAAHLDAEAGCGFIEFGVGIGITVSGEISGPSPTQFRGSYSGYIRLRFMGIPVDFYIDGSVSYNF